MTNPILHTDQTSYALIEPCGGGNDTLNTRVPEYDVISDTEAWGCAENGVNEGYQIQVGGIMVKGSASTAIQVAGIEVGALAAVNNYFFEVLLASNDFIKIYFRKQSANVVDDDATFSALAVYVRNNAGSALETRFVSDANDVKTGDPYAEHYASVDWTLKQGVLVTDKGSSVDISIGGVTVNHLVSSTAFADNENITNSHIGFQLTSTGTTELSNIKAW